MRTFEFARKKVNNNIVEELMYPKAKIPEYATLSSAGADFFVAEEVVIPSSFNLLSEGNIKEDGTVIDHKPTLVHTGIKASMGKNEVLKLYNRSSNPGKLGLVLANGVGVVDSDYYNNEDNDGEIMFAFYNFKAEDITLKVGDKIGQGVFEQFLRPEDAMIKDTVRSGGFGSTSRE